MIAATSGHAVRLSQVAVTDKMRLAFVQSPAPAADDAPSPEPPAPSHKLSTKTRNLGDVLQEFRQHRQLMQRELQKVIVGQDAVIEQIFAAIFTRGHCLLVGVPGLAKTLMVSTLARI